LGVGVTHHGRLGRGGGRFLGTGAHQKAQAQCQEKGLQGSKGHHGFSLSSVSGFRLIWLPAILGRASLKILTITFNNSFMLNAGQGQPAQGTLITRELVTLFS
jgi:hypothetical protein